MTRTRNGLNEESWSEEDALAILNAENDEIAPLDPFTLQDFRDHFLHINSLLSNNNIDQNLQTRVNIIIRLSEQVSHPEAMDPFLFGLYITNLTTLLDNIIQGIRVDDEEIEATLTGLETGLRVTILSEENLSDALVMTAIEGSYNVSIFSNLFEQKPTPQIDYIGKLGIFNFDITQMTEGLFQ